MYINKKLLIKTYIKKLHPYCTYFLYLAVQSFYFILIYINFYLYYSHLWNPKFKIQHKHGPRNVGDSYYQPDLEEQKRITEINLGVLLPRLSDVFSNTKSTLKIIFRTWYPTRAWSAEPLQRVILEMCLNKCYYYLVPVQFPRIASWLLSRFRSD